MSEGILFSIITVNYNNKIGLARTIASVVSQTYKGYELIIIDGFSSDGSQEIIGSNKEYVHYWVSEKDNGVYDAMNKGIARASGKYLFFLNSGDVFASSSVLKILSEVSEVNDSDILYGNFIYGDSLIKYRSRLSLYYVMNQVICHQVQFIKKQLFDMGGMYDLSYPITADHCKIMLFLVKYNATYSHVPIPVTIVEQPGISGVSIANNQDERRRFMQAEFPILHEDYTLLKRYEKNNLIKRLMNFISRKIFF